MLKIVGVVLLCGIALFFCVDYTRHQKQKLYQSEGILLLLRHLRGQIRSYSLPLAAAVADFENEALSSCGFLPLLKQGDFSAAVKAMKGKFTLSPESERALVAFAADFGKSYREEQLTLCDWAVEEFESAVARLRRESPKRAKMGRGLIVSGSLALILFLL